MATVLIISAAYTLLIEQFPTGGGGYLVASKLLHPNLGPVAGSALVIDYVLTMSVSIRLGGERGLQPAAAQHARCRVCTWPSWR